MNDTRLFAFENDFVNSLRCIPMAVRFKLDRCAIKLSLRQWSRLNKDDRRELLETPCDAAAEIDAYRARLTALVAERAREATKTLAEPPQPLWEAAGEAPPVVKSFAETVGVDPPSAEEWSRLSELQRFALIKLTRDNHDNVNFVPAMREFGLT